MPGSTHQYSGETGRFPVYSRCFCCCCPTAPLSVSNPHTRFSGGVSGTSHTSSWRNLGGVQGVHAFGSKDLFSSSFVRFVFVIVPAVFIGPALSRIWAGAAGGPAAVSPQPAPAAILSGLGEHIQTDGASGDDRMSGDALRRRVAGGAETQRGGKNMHPGMGVSQERMSGDSSSGGRRDVAGGVCSRLSSPPTGDRRAFLGCWLSDEGHALLRRAGGAAVGCCSCGVVGGGIPVLIVVCCGSGGDNDGVGSEWVDAFYYPFGKPLEYADPLWRERVKSHPCSIYFIKARGIGYHLHIPLPERGIGWSGRINMHKMRRPKRRRESWKPNQLNSSGEDVISSNLSV